MGQLLVVFFGVRSLLRPLRISEPLAPAVHLPCRTRVRPLQASLPAKRLHSHTTQLLILSTVLATVLNAHKRVTLNPWGRSLRQPA